MSSIKMRKCTFLIIIAAVALLACESVPKRIEPDNLVWPLPPDTPRIKYLRSIYTEDDIERQYSFTELLFGASAPASLIRPYGISARQGKVYVSDIGYRRVLVFDLRAKRVTALGDEGGIQMPANAVADSAGRVYVADAGGSKISLYDAGGGYTTAFVVRGSAPVSIALNESLGRIYVVDRRNHRVVTLGLDGRQLFEFGGRGNEDGKFNIPLDITLDSQGDLYVLDSGNFRVQMFNADGGFLGKFGSVGDAPGFFANPKGIAVDSDGHIYVTDAAFSNYQIFDRQGNTLLFVGTLGPRPGQMHLPAGIAIDQDVIYVADQLNRRIQVFEYLKAP